jgi:hypothetical protein
MPQIAYIQWKGGGLGQAVNLKRIQVPPGQQPGGFKPGGGG